MVIKGSTRFGNLKENSSLALESCWILKLPVEKLVVNNYSEGKIMDAIFL